MWQVSRLRLDPVTAVTFAMLDPLNLLQLTELWAIFVPNTCIVPQDRPLPLTVTEDHSQMLPERLPARHALQDIIALADMLTCKIVHLDTTALPDPTYPQFAQLERIQRL